MMGMRTIFWWLAGAILGTLTIVIGVVLSKMLFGTDCPTFGPCQEPDFPVWMVILFGTGFIAGAAGTLSFVKKGIQG
jgi:hypothetical protein